MSTKTKVALIAAMVLLGTCLGIYFLYFHMRTTGHEVSVSPDGRKNVRSRLAKVTVPFEDSFFTMDRPASWVPVKSAGPGLVQFHIPDVGSFLATVKDSPGGPVDLEQTARAAAQKLATDFDTVARNLEGFSAWGSYSGHGFRFAMNVDGKKETVARVFCGSLPDGRVLVTYEVCLARAEPQLQAQFEVVRKTLQIKPVK